MIRKILGRFAEEEREIQNKYTVEAMMLDSEEELPEVYFSLSLSVSFLTLLHVDSMLAVEC